jgi:hypothetical protein
MEKKNSDIGPVEVLRRFNDGEMTETDVISWAEAQIVAGNTLGQESSVINLAALSSDDDNSVRVSVLLEQLISEVVNFSISEHDIACARATMECIIRAREAPAIRKENCIEFLLGCCPQIASGTAAVFRR